MAGEWMTNSGLSRLRTGIVHQACKDYIDAIKAGNESKAATLEKFFHGQWYATLIDIDPDWLIKKLKENATSKRKTYYKNM